MLDDVANVLPTELERSAERFDDQQARHARYEGYGSTDYGLAIANHCIQRCTDGFQKLLAEPDTDIQQKLRTLLRALSPEVLSLCVLQTVVDSIARRCTLVETRDAVANALRGECWAAGLLYTPKKGVETTKKLMGRAALESYVRDNEKRFGRRSNTSARMSNARKLGEAALVLLLVPADWVFDVCVPTSNLVNKNSL